MLEEYYNGIISIIYFDLFLILHYLCRTRDKLHSKICEQIHIAFVCIIFALEEPKRTSL